MISPYTLCQYIHNANTPKANWMLRFWRLKTKPQLCTMTCYWLKVECSLTLVNKMETFGGRATFCAESQHDLVWGGQGQGFSCKNTILQMLKSLRVACGGKCATTNCYSLKVAYMTDGLITWISLQGKGGESRSATSGLKLMDTQINAQAVCGVFRDAVGKLKNNNNKKIPTERMTYPWAQLWAFRS